MPLDDGPVQQHQAGALAIPTPAISKIDPEKKSKKSLARAVEREEKLKERAGFTIWIRINRSAPSKYEAVFEVMEADW